MKMDIGYEEEVRHITDCECQTEVEIIRQQNELGDWIPISAIVKMVIEPIILEVPLDGVMSDRLITAEIENLQIRIGQVTLKRDVRKAFKMKEKTDA